MSAVHADGPDAALGAEADRDGAGPPALSETPTRAPEEPARMRIGEVAELTGTTARTIRYYEELGLLGAEIDRAQGKHRCYSDADVDRIREIVRLRDLLGLSLEQLSELVEAETARAEIRRELGETTDRGRRRELLGQALGHIETQLSLVRRRADELGALERELVERRERVGVKLAEL